MTHTPPDRCGPDGPTETPKSAAERMRKRYWRGKAKKQSLRINLTKEYLDQIVRDGRIKAEDLDNPEILGAEIEEDYYCQKRGTFRPGAICTTGTATSSG